MIVMETYLKPTLEIIGIDRNDSIVTKSVWWDGVPAIKLPELP